MALPSDYRQLEYIEANGAQYIDTGITVEKSDNWRCVLDADLVNNSNYAGANGYMQYQGNIGGGKRSEIDITYSDITETIKVDGNQVSSQNWSSYNGTNVKLGILKLGDTGNGWYSGDAQSGKIYGGKIYQGIKNTATYTVTNLIGAVSSFEASELSHSGEGYIYCNASHYKYGERALLITGASSAQERTYTVRGINQGFVQPTLTPSHKYYTRIETYQETKAGSTDVYWPIAEPPLISHLSGAAGQWNVLSTITDRSSFTAGNYQVRIDYNNEGSTAYMWFDGFMLVDLTATFGAGNEPSKDWCDANIPFTTDTVTVTMDLSDMEWNLVRNFIPCANASGTIGLYDTISDSFYASASSTAFVGGGVYY